MQPNSSPPGTAKDARADWSLLMAQAQDGDQVAYGVLLHAVTPYLRALSRRGGIEAADTEDAVQDILLTLHSIRHTYDRARPFGPWLVAVARYRLGDRLRRQGKRLVRETALTEFHETFSDDQTNQQERLAEGRTLRAAIAELPTGQRRAVEMLRLEELSLKEASARSGQSETALKVALHRAIKALRKLLDR
jgi:RNA polymerase sigma-70 factor (ECF subfamily)